MTMAKIKVFFSILLTGFILSSCSKSDDDTVPTTVDHTLSYGYNTEVIWCEHDGKRIYGEALFPQVEGVKLPLVIFSHGFRGNYNSSLYYAQLMAEHGYIAYRFDFCGGPTSNRSDGSTTEMSIRTQEVDLKAIIDQVSADERVDTSRIYLIGISQGGMVSAMTAADYPRQIGAAVLIYPGFIITDYIHKMFPNREDIPESFKFRGVTVGRIYAIDAYDYDIYTELPRFTKNVLIIHGTEDNVVPISYSERMVELYASAKLKRVVGAAHGFSGTQKAQATKWMLHFLNAVEKKVIK